MRHRYGIRATASTALVAGSLLSLGSPAQQFTAAGSALRDLRGSIERQGVDDTLLPVAAAAAWIVLAWTGCGLVLVLLGTAPGTVGRAGRWAAEHVLPGAMRRLLGAALGVGLAVGVAGVAVPAAAAPVALPVAAAPRAATAVPAVALHLDWPVTPAGAAEPVTVRPGDCLWSITAARLGPDAAPQAVASTWPRWWAANRDVIGDDPDLLHPGQQLTAPEVRTAPETRTP
jgi:hypothetical protein